MEVVIESKGQETRFTSAYDTDDKAIAKLAEYVNNGEISNNFARSLVKQSPKGLTCKQCAWVHKLIYDHEEIFKYSRITETMNHTATHLESPKMTFLVDDKKLVLRRNPDSHKRFPKDIVITIDGEQIGRIRPDGYFIGPTTIPKEIKDTLAQLNTNPITFAKAYGTMSGVCCFCHQTLTQQESLNQGYGPICARNYKMPWGRKV